MKKLQSPSDAMAKPKKTNNQGSFREDLSRRKGAGNIGSLIINQHVCRECTLIALNYSQASARFD